MHDVAIAKLMNEAISARVFPGGVVGIIQDGANIILPYGRLTYDADSPAVTKDTIYDLASVTKVIPTNSVILKLIEDGCLSENDKASDYLPELAMPDKETILIKHLLTFTAVFDMKERLSELSAQGATAVLEAIYNAPLLYPSGTRYLYSNAPVLLLGMIAERITKQPLDKLATEMFFAPLGMTHTTFHPRQLEGVSIAPAEINERGLVQADVHDGSAWAMYQAGLIAGHAGLFSCANDLLIFGQMLLNDGQYDGKQYFSNTTMSRIKTEVFNDGKFGMSLGWETGQSDYMSPNVSNTVYGKDGFTGTMIIVEPDKKRCLVLLTNRTYPKRPESSEAMNEVRRKLQDIVFI